jgi:hypothetical protein
MKEHEIIGIIAAVLSGPGAPTVTEASEAVLSARALLRIAWSLEMEQGRVTDGVRLRMKE